MAFYNYTCSKECKVKRLSKETKNKLIIEKHPKGILVWTVQHRMNDTPSIKCPVCASDAIKTMFGHNTESWVRGNCYLNRADCQRQMDLRLLETGKDPYRHMRQPGELDDLKQRLKKKKIKRK